MTREEKLFSMRMQDLVVVTENLGIKINKKGSKEKAIEKILAAEKIKEEKKEIASEKTEEKAAELEDDWEDSSYEEKKEEAAKSDAEAEAAVNKKKTASNAGSEKKTRPSKGAQLEYKGKSQNICAWARELGISPNTLYGRIYKMGWSIEKAFETPSRK